MLVASAPDLLRLVAVPVLGLAAYRDVRTRRVPNSFWYPLAVLGLLLLAWEWTTLAPGFQRMRFLRSTLLSIGIVVPLAYGFWRLGAFGGADAKALMAIAVLFPGYPTYYFPTEALPVVVTAVGVFSLTILTNAVLLGMGYPVALGLRNLVAGELDRRMFVGRPVAWRAVTETHGSLLSAPADGPRGLDLDALRMYLRWRRTDLATLRADQTLRDPETLPADPGEPTDGAVDTATANVSHAGSGESADPAQRESTAVGAVSTPDDPWGAAAFLASIEGDAYGTSAAQLRAGLDVLVSRDQVWISPGLPFLVPVFAGLLTALTVGDLLIGLFVLAGIA
ncbi:MAG: prepilin peptidase [Halobacteriaceae archaeon]